ncbi:MAG TPA: nicotinate phosphoribosyltransferase, partial [Vicinamibacteria bacterium]
MVPIIQSLLDLDFYKFTMGQLVFLKYREVPVIYSLVNRTREVRLAEFIDEAGLRQELDHVRSLSFNNSELHYLRGTNEYGERMFRENYLDFLRALQLPAYELEEVDGSFRLQFGGDWARTIYWETIALAVVNELYYRRRRKPLSRFEQDLVFARGKMRLAEKIRELRRHP